MSLLGAILHAISLLPFWVLHRFSDAAYFLIFYGLGYRKKVVWQNLKNSFPEKTDRELLAIQKKFYRNFCDLIFETIKSFSISEEEVLKRCSLENPEVLQKLWDDRVNVVGISSHMGNWEWLSLSLSIRMKHRFFAVFKPLAQVGLNRVVKKTRERFGGQFVSIKELRKIFDQPVDRLYAVGLLSDQAPHDYAKAFEFRFLNQPTYFVPGPGVLSVERHLVPMYGWIKRTGRSKYSWRLELLEEAAPEISSLNDEEKHEVAKVVAAQGLSEERAIRVWWVTRYFVRRLEEEIKMAPQDWLWSHRRWKSRS